MKKVEKGLGRGLDALIKPSFYEEKSTDAIQVSVHKVKPNPFQPRKQFNLEKIEELALSIRENGVLQPILVRQNKAHEYEIIAGERRWRASMEAGLSTVPALVRNYTDQEVLAIALIENLQREDLNPMEQAYALQRLQSELQISQDQLAARIGKSRPQLTNILRLTRLPEGVRSMVEDQRLSPGHARALLGIKDEKLMLQICSRILKNNLSVRQTENIVQKCLQPDKSASKTKKEQVLFNRDLENIIKQKTKQPIQVRLQGNKEKGQLVIKYRNREQLKGILSYLGLEGIDILEET